METVACCRARLAKTEGEHRGWLSLPPSSGDLGRGGVARRPSTEISTEAGGGCIQWPLSSKTHTGNHPSRGGKLLLHHFFPFYPPQHQARCLPCSRGAENVPGAGSTRVFKRFCSSTGSQRAITLNTHPLSFSLVVLLYVPHWLSFPSFLSSSLPLIPFRDSKGLIQHSTGRDKLKQ